MKKSKIKQCVDVEHHTGVIITVPLVFALGEASIRSNRNGASCCALFLPVAARNCARLANTASLEY
jgi:hypothetical protein